MRSMRMGLPYPATLDRDREPPRSPTSRRRGRSLRPTAEPLEGRTLMSLGLDATWGPGGVLQLGPVPDAGGMYPQLVNSIALEGGQVVAVGSVGAISPSGPVADLGSQMFAARFNTDGSLDTSFGSGGTVAISIPWNNLTYLVGAADVAVQADGKIDILGTARTPEIAQTYLDDFVVVQLNPDGSLDTSFGTGGYQLIYFSPGPQTTGGTQASAMAIGPDGKIVVVGSTTVGGNQVFAIARLNADGSLDTSFNGSGTQTVSFGTGGAVDQATAVAIEPDDSIVVAGSADLPASSSTPPNSDTAVARLTPSGALDTSFNGTGMLTFNQELGGSTSADTVTAVALEGSQIVLAGTSNLAYQPNYTGGYYPAITELTATRLNADGSFDTTFAGDGRFILALNQNNATQNTTGAGLIVQPDGTLLLAGTASVQGDGPTPPTTGFFARLTPTGALDPGYGTNGVAPLPVPVNGPMLVQTDAKVLFVSSLNGIGRTTPTATLTGSPPTPPPPPSPPSPVVQATTIMTTGTGKKARASGVTIAFNTAVNSTLASNITAYLVRPIKGKKAIKIKKRGIIYSAAAHTVTIEFAKKTAVGKGFEVLITPGGIVASDGQVLFDGAATPIVIGPATT